jgi:hypothetical protein
MEDKENNHPLNLNLTPTGRPFKKAVRRLGAKNGGEEFSGRQLKLTQVFNTVKKSKKRTYFETDIEEAKQVCELSAHVNLELKIKTIYPLYFVGEQAPQGRAGRISTESS